MSDQGEPGAKSSFTPTDLGVVFPDVSQRFGTKETITRLRYPLGDPPQVRFRDAP